MTGAKTGSELDGKGIEIEELGAVTANLCVRFFQPTWELLFGADAVPTFWVALAQELVRLELTGQQGIRPPTVRDAEEIAHRHVIGTHHPSEPFDAVKEGAINRMSAIKTAIPRSTPPLSFLNEFQVVRGIGAPEIDVNAVFQASDCRPLGNPLA